MLISKLILFSYFETAGIFHNYSINFCNTGYNIGNLYTIVFCIIN